MELLKNQHRTVERTLRELRSDGHHRDRLVIRLLEQLETHVAIELNVLYPELSGALRVGFERDVALLRRMKALLMPLRKRGLRGADFAGRIAELGQVFGEHVALQEGSVFPACAAVLTDTRLEDIASDVERVALGLMTKTQETERLSGEFAA